MGTKFATIYNRFLGKITDDMYLELTPEDTIKEEELIDEDFIVGIVWEDLDSEGTPWSIVDRSHFNMELTSEEINILAILMKQGWVQRQVTSIENTRMKYTSADFKMTS